MAVAVGKGVWLAVTVDSGSGVEVEVEVTLAPAGTQAERIHKVTKSSLCIRILGFIKLSAGFLFQEPFSHTPVCIFQ